jgi:hypothetical protein
VALRAPQQGTDFSAYCGYSEGTRKVRIQFLVKGKIVHDTKDIGFATATAIAQHVKHKGEIYHVDDVVFDLDFNDRQAYLAGREKPRLSRRPHFQDKGLLKIHLVKLPTVENSVIVRGLDDDEPS